MKQRKIHSFLEALTNTAIGWIVSFVFWITVVRPLFGIETTMAENVHITNLFTVISILRGYLVRRWYEIYLNDALTRLANYLEDWRTNRV